MNVRKGDRVIVFNRIFDGNCDLCLSGRENLCYNGGLWGVETNGGLTEKITIIKKIWLKYLIQYLMNLPFQCQ
ncbi:MAG: alcohol dehydrogenase catalytic domain-containing protein [Thermoplasmataceae archaeon]